MRDEKSVFVERVDRRSENGRNKNNDFYGLDLLLEIRNEKEDREAKPSRKQYEDRYYRGRKRRMEKAIKFILSRR